VIAKPAEQTPLIAARAVRFLHEAGIPHGVLSILPGDGAKVGARLVNDRRVAGVVFTGSTATPPRRSTARWPPATARSRRWWPRLAASM